jgi:Txe/YoeB family toxin of Txe-Axe toxin-antitoxin module
MKSEVYFVDEKLKEAYEDLKEGKFEDKRLYEYIGRAIEDLKKDNSAGIHVPKKLIPKDYKKYGIDNLWKYDLPNGWRLMYSVADDEVKIISIVLEWLDHKNYERRFGY